MLAHVDYKEFQAHLNTEYSGIPVSEQEAAEAFHNLKSLLNLLVRINEREKIVKF